MCREEECVIVMCDVCAGKKSWSKETTLRQKFNDQGQQTYYGRQIKSIMRDEK